MLLVLCHDELKTVLFGQAAPLHMVCVEPAAQSGVALRLPPQSKETPAMAPFGLRREPERSADSRRQPERHAAFRGGLSKPSPVRRSAIELFGAGCRAAHLGVRGHVRALFRRDMSRRGKRRHAAAVQRIPPCFPRMWGKLERRRPAASPRTTPRFPTKRRHFISFYLAASALRLSRVMRLRREGSLGLQVLMSGSSLKALWTRRRW